jgi:hypothetical protein
VAPKPELIDCAEGLAVNPSTGECESVSSTEPVNPSPGLAEKSRRTLSLQIARVKGILHHQMIGITKEEIMEMEVTMAEIITVATMILMTRTVVAETMKMVVLNKINFLLTTFKKSVLVYSGTIEIC